MKLRVHYWIVKILCKVWPNLFTRYYHDYLLVMYER